jgi:hypothetical protein
MGGELGTEEAGAKKPDGDAQTGAGNGADFLAGFGIREIMLKLEDVFRETVGSGGDVATEGAGGGLVSPRSAAEAEIDAGREERGEGAELFSDDEGRMIGEHDAAGADTDGSGATGDVGDDDGGGGAGDAGHVVVLGEPVTVVAPGFCVLGEVERVAEGDGGAGGLGNGGKVEDGEGDHGSGGS